jgi:hypothetical protein
MVHDCTHIAHENHEKEDENHDKTLDSEQAISINARGSICNDMPMFSLVMDMIYKAIEYKLGYEGIFLPTNCNGAEWDKDVSRTFRYKRTYKKIGYAKEHAIVHHLDQYRKVIDSELRTLLGEEAYAERETLPETETIPEGFVL